MKYICFAVCVLAASALATGAQGADKSGPVRGEGSDKHVRVEATAYLDRDSIRQAVGMEMEEGFIVIEVKVTPAEGHKLNLMRDDFLIRSDKDGQRGTPYSPTQIAGSSVLVVKTGYSGGAVAQQSRGPSWGGLGGGMPGQLPGGGPSGIGNTASQESAVASVEDGPLKEKGNPLLPLLEKNILAEKEIEAPVSGQLYFLLEGKHKTKQVELLYKTPSGRVSVRFK
ncbi:MAG: hypothetical protein R2762_10600 [Bryobacteraceae bacterium]